MPTAVAMKRAEAVRKLAERPEALLEQVAQRTAGMGRLAPNTAAAVSTKVQAAVAFLSQAAPKPPPMPLDVPALRRTWRPSDVELSKFARKLSAVENPVGVLRRMAAGAVTREEVDAVRAVYPSLYEDMRNTLVAKLSEQKKPLDYRRTVALSHVLGEPLDSTLTPQAVAFYQANHAAKAEQPQRRPSGGRVQERLGSETTDAQRISNRSART